MVVDCFPSPAKTGRPREKITDEVMFGICAAIDRAFERGGAALIADADRERRATKRHVRENACLVDGAPTMAGWIAHGKGVYHHVSDPRVLVRRSGIATVRRNGKATKVTLWAWRAASADDGKWTGQEWRRADAFEDGRWELDQEGSR